MPELPEVETIVRQMRDRFLSRSINDIKTGHPDVFNIRPGRLRKALSGNCFESFTRLGKHICGRTERGSELWFHLGMSGRLVFSDKDDFPGKHTHLGIYFADGLERLYFRDPRRFGYVYFQERGAEPPPSVLRLGPDAMAVGEDEFISSFFGRKAGIKVLLMNQSLVAGIGNIYADEMLFRAGILPTLSAGALGVRRWKRLFSAMRSTLQEAIECGGSTIDDYRQLDGSFGTFQKRHHVYGRTGKACFVCRRKVKMVRLAGRSSHFCTGCQK